MATLFGLMALATDHNDTWWNADLVWALGGWGVIWVAVRKVARCSSRGHGGGAKGGCGVDDAGLGFGVTLCRSGGRDWVGVRPRCGPAWGRVWPWCLRCGHPLPRRCVERASAMYLAREIRRMIHMKTPLVCSVLASLLWWGCNNPVSVGKRHSHPGLGRPGVLGRRGARFVVRAWRGRRACPLCWSTRSTGGIGRPGRSCPTPRCPSDTTGRGC